MVVQMSGHFGQGLSLAIIEKVLGSFLAVLCERWLACVLSVGSDL